MEQTAKKREKKQRGGRCSRGVYRVVRALVKLCYPKCRVVGREHLPEGGCIVVGNHAKMNGPILSELYFPGERAIWTAGEMFHLKEVPAYAYKDFWSGKPKHSRPFYRILSYLIAPLSVCVFNNAHTVPVYHDARILSTFRETVEKLKDGARVIVFPEHGVKHDHIVNEFQSRFVEVAALYHRRTGQRLCFVPMYVAPAFHAAFLGRPVWYDPSQQKRNEQQRIAAVLMERIREIAEALPPHTVVPYDNVPKHKYPKNRPAPQEQAHKDLGPAEGGDPILHEDAPHRMQETPR